MIRLGEFNKDGYKQNFSKGELARELVYMNNDYDNLKKENQKYKEVINKVVKFVKENFGCADNGNDMFYYLYPNELYELLNILKEVEHE